MPDRPAQAGFYGERFTQVGPNLRPHGPGSPLGKVPPALWSVSKSLPPTGSCGRGGKTVSRVFSRLQLDLPIGFIPGIRNDSGRRGQFRQVKRCVALFGCTRDMDVAQIKCPFSGDSRNEFLWSSIPISRRKWLPRVWHNLLRRSRNRWRGLPPARNLFRQPMTVRAWRSQ